MAAGAAQIVQEDIWADYFENMTRDQRRTFRRRVALYTDHIEHRLSTAKR